MKINVILPTIHPDLFVKYALPNFELLKEYAHMMCVNIIFQQYTSEKVAHCVSALEKMGYKVVYDCREYDPENGKTPDLMRINNDTALLNMDCDYWLMLDDDIQWNDKIKDGFRIALEEIETHKEIGYVEFSNAEIPEGVVKIQGYDKKRWCYFWQNLGNLLVNCYNQLCTDESYAKYHYGETDVLFACERFRDGHTCIKVAAKNLGTHIGNKPLRGAEMYGWGSEKEPNAIHHYLYSKRFYKNAVPAKRYGIRYVKIK